jgi:peptidoglycan/LPS O-acetylase OafA/YrhL
VDAPKPARLDALTGLRCFAALNIVFFHFDDPRHFGPLAPVVNAGYLSVSFFIMLSGYVLAYNYAGRAREGKLDKVRFWKARLSRLYPIYLLSLVLGFETFMGEPAAHTRLMFWLGAILTPLLLQGWIPEIATFGNTPAWTMSAEAAYYMLFPWMASWKLPSGANRLLGHLWRLGAVWLLGLIPGTLYVLFNPDGIALVDRFSVGPWLQALKFTPLPHLPSFLFGVMLAGLDEILERTGWLRLVLGLTGFAGIYGVLTLGTVVPYALIHDGLLMPLFGCLILGLAGTNLLSKFFGFRVFVFVGESSYCLYLMHFNLWTLLHQSGLLERFGLVRFDPWISYAILVALGLLALHLVEKPMQKLLRQWMAA